MVEFVRTNDIVLVGFRSRRAARRRQYPSSGAGPEHERASRDRSASCRAVSWSREDDNRAARQLLAEAGLAHELRPDD